MDVYTGDPRCCVAGAEGLHLTRPARRPSISRAALIEQIPRLERTLRAALFVRVDRIVAPTPAGTEAWLETERGPVGRPDRVIRGFTEWEMPG